MPVISRIASIVLRFGELAFGAVVAGIIGSYLDGYDSSTGWPHARFIYTIVVAGLSMLLALLWLVPFTSNFTSWPIDFILSLAWFAAFGLLVNFLHGTCNSSAFDWGGLTGGGSCNRWKAAEAFSFLSAVFWLVSAIVGIWFVRRETRKGATTTTSGKSHGTYTRRSWFGGRRHV